MKKPLYMHALMHATMHVCITNNHFRHVTQLKKG